MRVADFRRPLFLPAMIKPAESAFGVLTGYQENEDYDF